MGIVSAFSGYKTSIVAAVKGSQGSSSQQQVIVPSGNVTDKVESYRSTVYERCKKFGTEKYIDLFLAVIMQESGGNCEDIFQCSESLGLKPNSINTEQSIEQGVKVLSNCLKLAGVESEKDIPRIKLALQGYNFGSGYIKYALTEDGGWTQQNTNDFAAKKSNYKKRTGKKAELMGEWAYGDQYYTEHVLRYYSYYSINQDFYTIVLDTAKSCLGKPYEWAASGPDSFDCSGLVYYCYNAAGFNKSRTTAAQYHNMSTIISKEEAVPGDLVFFRNSSGKIHHVGIYVGNDQMIHAPQTGDVVKYANTRIKNDEVIYGRLK